MAVPRTAVRELLMMCLDAPLAGSGRSRLHSGDPDRPRLRRLENCVTGAAAGVGDSAVHRVWSMKSGRSMASGRRREGAPQARIRVRGSCRTLMSVMMVAAGQGVGSNLGRAERHMGHHIVIAFVVVAAIAAGSPAGAEDAPVRVAGGLVAGRPAATPRSGSSKASRSPRRRSATCAGARLGRWWPGRASGRPTSSAPTACRRSSRRRSPGRTSSWRTGRSARTASS